MPFRLPVAVPRILLTSIAYVALLTCSLAESEHGIGPFTGPEADAEAARLYNRADAYVRHVDEGQYSYAYMQFYWKRAGANIDRILRAYPSSPTAKKILADELRVGPFEHIYFKERVLPRLEEKKVGSFDAVNSAIFLYELKGNHDSPTRRDLLAQIITTLCWQKRWGEALNFPVLEEGKAWLWQIVTGMAVYKHQSLADQLIKNTAKEDLPALLDTVAHYRAFRGDPADELEKFLAQYPGNANLRAAAFSGLVRREIPIQRAVLLKLPLKGIFDGYYAVEKPDQRADLAAFLSTIPPGPALERARHDYARYLAAIGQLDEARKFADGDQLDVAVSYAKHLIDFERYQEAITLPQRFSLSPATAAAFRLQLIELLAQSGRDEEVASVRKEIPANLSTQAVYDEWRGRILSTENQLVVRERTFADIPFHDPNLLGQLVCEWSLTPNRTLRGAAPWDAIVYKFAPGFENLPPPKDQKKVEAAGR